MTRQDLIAIDSRFRTWTDFVPHLLTDADGGRYIEVYEFPGRTRKFVTGNNDKRHAHDRYWVLKWADPKNVKLLGVFDKIKKADITDSYIMEETECQNSQADKKLECSDSQEGCTQVKTRHRHTKAKSTS